MKTQLFLLLLALSVLSTQAQSLSIKGRVTDASQEAVIAANVSLWTIDSTLVTGVTSDAQGKFALPKNQGRRLPPFPSPSSASKSEKHTAETE